MPGQMLETLLKECPILRVILGLSLQIAQFITEPLYFIEQFITLCLRIDNLAQYSSRLRESLRISQTLTLLNGQRIKHNSPPHFPRFCESVPIDDEQFIDAFV